MSVWKLYHKDTEEPSRGELEPAPVGVLAEFNCRVKQNVAKCDVHLTNNM